MPNSSPTIDGPPLEGPESATASLAVLRAEIDRLDDAIHDLLMQRGDVVSRVGRSGGKGGVALRAGREAAIVRRLLARHAGPLPKRAIVRVWRELLAATTSMQGAYTIAVCERDPNADFLALAREHFGASTAMRTHSSAAQAIRDVSSGAAVAALLPVPQEDEASAAAWWTTLLHRDDPRIHIVAKLPFWAPRSDGAPRARGFVVAAVPPDPSGQDRSLIGLELPVDMSRARLAAALKSAGFANAEMMVRRDPSSPVCHVLLDVEGLVVDGDVRLAAVGGRPVVLGAYAVPIDGEGV